MTCMSNGILPKREILYPICSTSPEVCVLPSFIFKCRTNFILLKRKVISVHPELSKKHLFKNSQLFQKDHKFSFSSCILSNIWKTTNPREKERASLTKQFSFWVISSLHNILVMETIVPKLLNVT